MPRMKDRPDTRKKKKSKKSGLACVVTSKRTGDLMLRNVSYFSRFHAGERIGQTMDGLLVDQVRTGKNLGEMNGSENRQCSAVYHWDP